MLAIKTQDSLVVVVLREVTGRPLIATSPRIRPLSRVDVDLFESWKKNDYELTRLDRLLDFSTPMFALLQVKWSAITETWLSLKVITRAKVIDLWLKEYDVPVKE